MLIRADTLTGLPTRMSTRVSKTNCESVRFSSAVISASGLTNVGWVDRMSAVRVDPSECAMIETRPLAANLGLRAHWSDWHQPRAPLERKRDARRACIFDSHP